MVTTQQSISAMHSEIPTNQLQWLAQLVEPSLSSREVVGSFPGRVIPKTSKMVPAALSLDVQHKGWEQGDDTSLCAV